MSPTRRSAPTSAEGSTSRGVGYTGSGVLRPQLEPGGGVGGELERPVGDEVVQAGERAEAGHETVGAPRDQRRIEDLVGAVDGAADEEAPLLGRRAREPQEVERDGELGAPPVRDAGHRRVPDRVPGVREVDVPVEEAVAERSRRVHPEVVAAAPVVGGVDADLHQVPHEHRVAPPELALDELGLRGRGRPPGCRGSGRRGAPGPRCGARAPGPGPRPGTARGTGCTAVRAATPGRPDARPASAPRGCARRGSVPARREEGPRPSWQAGGGGRTTLGTGPGCAGISPKRPPDFQGAASGRPEARTGGEGPA